MPIKCLKTLYATLISYKLETKIQLYYELYDLILKIEIFNLKANLMKLRLLLGHINT